MQALYNEGGLDAGAHQDLVRLYMFACVEHAFLDGTLGVFDGERIAEIARLFGLEYDHVAYLWGVTAEDITAVETRCREAAHRQLDRQHEARVSHAPYVDLRECAFAFRLTRQRKAALFGARAGRPTIHTGMPTVEIEGVSYIVVPAVPDGPGANRFTTAERKALCDECRVLIDTVRRWERELTEPQLQARISQRRKTVETMKKQEAERAARAGRRRRAPGKTVAVRRYAQAMGLKERQAWTRCQDLSTDEIIARTPRQVLVEITRPSRHMQLADCSDKGSETPVSVSRGLSREVSHCSDNCSDKDAPYPAFFDTSLVDTPCTSTARTPVTETAAKPKRKRRPKALHEVERAALDAHYRHTNDGVLRDDLIRQWRSRKQLKQRVKEALDWHFAERDLVVPSTEPLTAVEAEVAHLYEFAT